MSGQDELLLTDEGIEEKLDNDWDGLDQPSLVKFVQEFTLAKVKPIIEKQKEDEFALRYNPDYLDFQKGVKATEEIWKVKVEEAKKQERERITKIILKVAKEREENFGSQRGWVTDIRQALRGEK